MTRIYSQKEHVSNGEWDYRLEGQTLGTYDLFDITASKGICLLGKIFFELCKTHVNLSLMYFSKLFSFFVLITKAIAA